MPSSLRCKVTGHDLDDCGVCRRCGTEAEPNHEWKETTPRKRECYRLEVCARCEQEKEIADHDWEQVPGKIPDTMDLKCSRCGLQI